MGTLTLAEIIAVVVALIDNAPAFVKWVEETRANGLPLLHIPPEHQAAVNAALVEIRSKAAPSANPVVSAVAEQMG